MTAKPRLDSRLVLSVATVLCLFGLGLAAQRPSVSVHDDDITIRGCVTRGASTTFTGNSILAWTRSDIMLSNAMAAQTGQAHGVTDRVFYWLEEDDDLSKHVGQMVEVKGDLGDFKKGEVEIDRDGDFTDIKLKLGGKTEKARVPTSWLGASAKDGEVDIITRKIDVDGVKVLGACGGR
jgi:hypothetical protein